MRSKTRSRRLRAASAPVPRATIDALLALVDEMSARVKALDTPPAASPVLPDLGPSNRLPPEEASRALHADVAEMDDLLDGVTELHAQLAPARRALGAVERARRLAEVISDQLAAPRTDDGQRPAPVRRRGRSPRSSERCSSASSEACRRASSRPIAS